MRFGVARRFGYVPGGQGDSVLTMTKRGITTIRLDDELKERLDQYAERTRRSRNGAVNYIVREFLDRTEQEQKPE